VGVGVAGVCVAVAVARGEAVVDVGVGSATVAVGAACTCVGVGVGSVWPQAAASVVRRTATAIKRPKGKRMRDVFIDILQSSVSAPPGLHLQGASKNPQLFFAEGPVAMSAISSGSHGQWPLF